MESLKGLGRRLSIRLGNEQETGWLLEFQKQGPKEDHPRGTTLHVILVLCSGFGVSEERSVGVA